MRHRHSILLLVLSSLLFVAPTFASSAPVASNLVIDPAPAPVGDPFEACEPIITNTTTKTQIKTVRICNPGDFSMDVDVSGKVVITVPAGKCRTIIIELKPGEFLHADHDGTISYPVATAVSSVDLRQ